MINNYAVVSHNSNVTGLRLTT